jgi:hypothetical protein
VPFENEAGLTVTVRKTDVPDWIVKAVLGDSVSQPAPQLVVRTDGVNVTALPVLFESVTVNCWDAAPAVTLYVSEAGLAVTLDVEPIFIVTGTDT